MCTLLKISGLCLVVLFFALSGYCASLKLSLRKKELSYCLNTLKKIKNGIVYRGTELSSLLPECLPNSGVLYFENGRVGLLENCLKGYEAKLLNEYFSSVGSGTKKEETEKADSIINEIAACLNEAKEEYAKKSKIFCTGGICLGILAAVLLI